MIARDVALVSKNGRSALAWIDAQLEGFSPWRDNELSMEGLQALSELALLYIRLNGPHQVWQRLTDDNSIIQRWRSHLVEQVQNPALAELPRKRPLHAFPYLLPYLVLRSTGWREPFYERTLDILMSWGLPNAQELVPFRELDVMFFLNKSGYGVKRDLIEVYERTFLKRMKGIVHIDNDSAYAITHTLMYMSDFGADKLALSEGGVSSARQVVESLTVHYWRIRHWDLLGELLFAATIIGSPQRTLFPNALAAFLGAHFDDGSIAGRVENEPQIMEARLGNDKACLFSGCYHTTIVSLLLANQLLEGER